METQAELNLAQAKTATTKVTASKPKAAVREIRMFVSYSHVDAGIREKLETHLAALKRDEVLTWYDGDLNAGQALDPNIARALRQSHIFIALLSPEYIASNYCWKLEYMRAMNRRARGTLHVVAVVVRPCDWRATTAAGFKLLPTDGKPVSRWRSQDQALLDITQGIRKVVQAIRKDLTSLKPPVAPRATKDASAPPKSRAVGQKAPPKAANLSGKWVSHKRPRKTR